MSPMAGVRVGVGETSELGSRALVAGVRVGKVEEGGVGELGSGAVVVVVRVGKVEEGMRACWVAEQWWWQK